MVSVEFSDKFRSSLPVFTRASLPDPIGRSPVELVWTGLRYKYYNSS